MKIHLDILQTIIAANNTHDMSIFLWMKQKHTNSQHYNFTYYNLSKKFGKSQHFVKKYIKQFIENGWCVVLNDKHLLFKSINGIYNYHYQKGDNKKTIFVKGNNYKEIQASLLFGQVRLDMQGFTFIKYHSKNLQSKGKKRVHSQKVLDKLGYRVVDEAQKRYRKSIKSFALQFNCSTSKACKIIKDFVKRKWIKKFSSRQFITGRALGFNRCKDWLRNGLFCTKQGCLFFQKPNEYSLR